jgi:hypothetical protein
MRRVVISLLSCAAALLFFSTAAFADECFKSSKKLNNDAQIIRLKAMDMGWKVGKTVSLAAASAISGKNGIYPKDDVEICLKEEDDELQIRAQSKSRDAGKAKWHMVMGKRSQEL